MRCGCFFNINDELIWSKILKCFEKFYLENIVKSSNLSDKMLSSLCVGLGIFLEKYKFYNSEILTQAFNSIMNQYKSKILLERK